MPYNYPTLAPALPNELMGTNNPLAGMAGTAVRAGLGVATGGTSEIITQILNLVPSIFQGITGASQLRKANALERQNKRPIAEIAPSVNKLTNYAYGQTLNQDIPGGEMYRNEIKGATAAGLRQASELGSGSEAYGMLGQLVGREQNSFGDLAKLTAQQVQSSKGEYMNALGVKAGEENRVWDYNKAQPYQQAAATASQLRNSGTQNVFAGVKNAFGSTAELISPDFNSSLLNGGSTAGAATYSLEDIAKALKALKGQ